MERASLRERQARARQVEPQEQQGHSYVEELKAKIKELTAERDQLKPEVEMQKMYEKLRDSTDNHMEGEEMDGDSECSQLLRLMGRHIQLKDLLNTYHILGGYNIRKSRQGETICVSLTTMYEGVYLDTYNVHVDRTLPIRMLCHNIPPFILINNVVERNDVKKDIKVYMDALSQLLNAYAGRKQQLKLMKEQHDFVEVLESNLSHSLLLLMFTMPGKETALLCKLSYNDRTSALPTQVTIECEDEDISDSPQWKKNCSLLQDTPLHTALMTMRQMRDIV